MEHLDCFALIEKIRDELVDRHDRLAYATMDFSKIPAELLYLSRFAELFGINDDGVSIELVKAIPIHCLEFFSTTVRELEDELENWLVRDANLVPPSLEYLKFTTMFMAFDCANSIIVRAKS